MAGFIFGGDTGMSYEALQRKRKITDALMQQQGQPRNVAEGLGSAAKSIVGALLNKKLDKREDQMRSDRQGQFTDLFGGGATPASYDAPVQDVAAAMGGDMSQYRDAIASIESAGSGDYNAVGPTNKKLGRALGRYQIMEANIGPWSREALGREVSADEFLANPKLQDAIFDHKFGGYVNKFGPEGAAQAWFAGPGGVGKTGRKDVLGTSVGQYGQKFTRALGGAPSGSGGQSRSPADLAQLAQFAADPLLDPAQRKIAEIMLQREMQQGDPMTQLDMQYKQAQIDKMNNPQAAELPASVVEAQWRAEQSGLEPGTPEYQNFVLNGGGDPATFRALDMQAQAAGYQKGTPEYRRFMATRGAGDQSYASTAGKNAANIDSGGEAARAVSAGASQGKADVVASSEVKEMERNMPGLLTVVDQLNGLADTATYTMAGQGRDYVKKQLGLDPGDGAVARAEYIAVVDNQVLPLLRQTFGAAFTAKEGDTLRATLGDPDKSPAEKKAVMEAFIAQKKRDLMARGGELPAASQSAPDQSAPATLPQTSLPPAPNGFDGDWEAVWEAMTEEDRRLFQ